MCLLAVVALHCEPTTNVSIYGKYYFNIGTGNTNNHYSVSDYFHEFGNTDSLPDSK